MTSQSGTAPGIATNVAWTVGAIVGSRLVTLVGLAVLARLLAPTDFGLMAFALVYITYVTAVGDLGAGAALVYWPERREAAAQVTFVVSVGMGVLWLVATWLLAPAVAAFFNNDGGAALLGVLAWTFPLQALGTTHEALCRKSLHFRAWLLPELAFAGSKAAVSVILAALGHGVWSLVWGQLAGQLLRTALFWAVVPWRPSRRVPWDLVRPMFAYGRSIVGLNALSVVVHHLDVVIVARALGAAALGFYQLGAKIPETTITLLVRSVSYVIFPTLSRAHAERQSLASAYLPTLRGVALATIPGVAVIVVLADPLVRILYGERWVPSVPVVQALTLAAGLRALGTHAGDLLKAVGKPNVLVVLAAVKATVLVPALAVASGHGMGAVALATAAVSALSMVLNIGLSCRRTGVTLPSACAALWPGIGVALVVTAALGTGRAALGPAGPVTTLALGLPTALIAAVLALRWVAPADLDVVRNTGLRLAERVRGAPAPAVGANVP